MNDVHLLDFRRSPVSGWDAGDRMSSTCLTERYGHGVKEKEDKGKHRKRECIGKWSKIKKKFRKIQIFLTGGRLIPIKDPIDQAEDEVIDLTDKDTTTSISCPTSGEWS